MICTRCNGTQKLRSGAHCPDCTHVINWGRIFRPGSGRAVPTVHRVSCSCGWSHSESSRQNALGRASKMRSAVNNHLKSVEEMMK